MLINVLGLGESLSRYSDGFAIGVNDIWSRVKTPIVVCVDSPAKFKGERLKTLDDCKPEMFYSHREEWKFKKGFQLINLQHPKGQCDLDLETIPHSTNSPFVACGLAYKLGAKEIRLYGVDLKTHWHLSKKEELKITLEHYQKLFLALKGKNVLLSVCKESLLSEYIPAF